MIRLYKWIVEKIKNFNKKRRFNKKLKELRKRDPFTYKH